MQHQPENGDNPMFDPPTDHRPEPAADISSYKMTTIREGGDWRFLVSPLLFCLLTLVTVLVVVIL